MSHSHACCTIAPVASDYQPVGTFEKVGAEELPVYTVGPQDAKKALVVLYDIFGMHNNTKQFCDILAKQCGYKVVLPDFFRGDAWTEEKMGDREALLAWIGKVGTIEVVAPQIKSVGEWLQSQGVVKAGLIGLCWGGKIAVQVTAMNPFFGGASLIHPAFVDVKDAEKAGAPILAIPSKDEPDMTEYMKVLSQKPFADKCEHHRFDDMHHGFVGARANYNDELNKKRATEAIQLNANFFSKVLSDN